MTTSSSTLWQSTIEIAVETGQTPLLDLDLSPGILPSLPSLITLADFAAGRVDLTTPTVIAGGESCAWLVALLITPRTAPPQQAPGLAVTFGGGDQTTQMASVAIYQRQPTNLSTQRQREVPRGFTPWFAPSQQAGPTTWAAWPFTFWAERSSQTQLTPGASDLWLPWAGLLLAGALVLAALFV